MPMIDMLADLTESWSEDQFRATRRANLTLVILGLLLLAVAVTAGLLDAPGVVVVVIVSCAGGYIYAGVHAARRFRRIKRRQTAMRSRSAERAVDPAPDA